MLNCQPVEYFVPKARKVTEAHCFATLIGRIRPGYDTLLNSSGDSDNDSNLTVTFSFGYIVFLLL